MSDLVMERLSQEHTGPTRLTVVEPGTPRPECRNVLALPDELLLGLCALVCSDEGNVRRRAPLRNANFAAIRLSCKRLAAVGLDAMIEYAKDDASRPNKGLSIKYDMTEKSLAQIELVAGHPRLSEMVETIMCVGYELQASENQAEGSATRNSALPRRLRPLTYGLQAEKRLQAALTRFPILHRIVYERRRTQHHDVPLHAWSIGREHLWQIKDTLMYHAW